MRIRFRVDQAECLRRGIDWDEYTCTIQIDPSTIPEDERKLVAEYLEHGCDVRVPRRYYHCHDCVVTKEPNYASLIERLKESVEEEKEKQRMWDEEFSAHMKSVDLEQLKPD